MDFNNLTDFQLIHQIIFLKKIIYQAINGNGISIRMIRHGPHHGELITQLRK